MLLLTRITWNQKIFYPSPLGYGVIGPEPKVAKINIFTPNTATYWNFHIKFLWVMPNVGANNSTKNCSNPFTNKCFMQFSKMSKTRWDIFLHWPVYRSIANDVPHLMQLKFLINYRSIIDKSIFEYRKVDIFNKQ